MNTTATLTGSPKQIVWAEKIRTTVLAAWQSYCEREDAEASGSNGLLPDKKAALLAHHVRPAEQAWLEQHVFGQTSAKWWIDNRSVNWLDRSSAEVRQLRREVIDAARTRGEI